MFQLHVKKQCCAFVFLIGLALKYAIIFVGIESTVLNLRLLRKMLFSSFCILRGTRNLSFQHFLFFAYF